MGRIGYGVRVALGRTWRSGISVTCVGSLETDGTNKLWEARKVFHHEMDNKARSER